MNLLLCVTLALGAGAPKKEVAPPPPADLVAASVLVATENGYGSGVAVKNGEQSYVWTDAHVIEDCKRVEKVLDPLGKEGQRIRFVDVTLVQDEVEGGRKVGEVHRLAQVIRYSERHDVAVLKVYKKGWPARGTTFLADDEVPEVGSKLWHVGSMQGERGTNSVSEGVFAAAGRLRRSFKPEEKDDPILYDQVSLTAHPGSSGGGVFAQKDGRCIGLVTEFLGPRHTFGAVCITPARRLRSFARETACEWALDGAVQAPKEDRSPVFVDTLVIPPAPAGPPTP